MEGAIMTDEGGFCLKASIGKGVEQREVG